MPYKDADKMREYSRLWKKRNPKRFKEYMKKWHKKRREEIRKAVLEHYGGIPPKCACCGESRAEFLTIDHVQGNGNQHKRRIRKTGAGFTRWLMRNNFPDGFRVLCYNCNSSLGHYGYCPHEKEGVVLGP